MGRLFILFMIKNLNYLIRKTDLYAVAMELLIQYKHTSGVTMTRMNSAPALRFEWQKLV